jgi:type I restriction enzyme M protein
VAFRSRTRRAIKVDYLLKFFEALAHFAATVLLSACISDSELFEANRSGWFAVAEHRPIDLQRASFGAWVELTKRLARTLTAVLEADGGGERACALFKTRDLELVEALVSREFVSILNHACNRRNSWTGHGGVAGGHVQGERLRDLDDLLVRTRAVLGWSFETWTLLRPGPMTRSGKVFDLTATILTGTNPVFRRQQIKLTEALDTSRLYLLNVGNPGALELLPFVRVTAGSSGQDACYFYNRVEGTGIRWISYHFHADPELLLPDEDLIELLATLTGSAPPDDSASPTGYR